MTTRIQLRRDTAVRWASVNPVLAAGEPAVESDTGKVKVGDGASAWAVLPYILDVSDLTPIIEQMVANGIPNAQVRAILAETLAGDGEFIDVQLDAVNNVLRVQAGPALGALADEVTQTSEGLATKVNSSTYVAGLAAKQDVATLDAAVAPLVDDTDSATWARLRAAFGRAAPVLSDFVYDGAANLISYKEDGIPIVLTYNPDSTVATSKRGTEPTQTFSYSGGNLAGVA